MSTKVEIKVHNATPRVARGGSTIFLVEGDITLFFTSPSVAKALGESLQVAAEMAQRVADIEKEPQTAVPASEVPA